MCHTFTLRKFWSSCQLPSGMTFLHIQLHGSLSSLPPQQMIRSTPLALCTCTRQVDCPLCSGANRRQRFTWGSVLKYLPSSSSKFTRLKFLIFFHFTLTNMPVNAKICTTWKFPTKLYRRLEALRPQILVHHSFLCNCVQGPPPHPQVKPCVKPQCVSQLMWLLSSKGLSTLIVYTGGIPFLIN